MKITVHGPRAGYGPDGTIHSWGPDQAVEVADSDKKAVAWARVMTSTGAATVVEDARTAAKPGPKPDPAAAPAPARKPASR